MKEQRDLEAERQELLKQIEARLSQEVRKALQAASERPLVPKVTVSTNEVGSAHAD
ncbi:MAG: hypothetical protein Kow001_10770 [Acidobacteriota bacterium]